MSASRKLSRELLLSKTAHLFAMRGYEESTITTITAELGVTRPTLYTYMRSKQELIEAIYDQLFDFYRQALPEYVHPEDPPLLRIRGIIELQLEATTRLRDHLMLVMRRFDELVERYPHIRAWWHELDTILLDAIEEARASGACAPEVDPVVLKHVIWAVINDLPFWYKPGRLSKQDIANQLVLVFSAGAARAAQSETPGEGTGQ